MPQNDYRADLTLDDLSKATGKDAQQVKLANVFRAEAEQELYALSVATPAPNITVSLSVYLLSEDTKDPTDGTLAATAEQSFPLSGYHRVSLKETVPLHEGDRYSIAARFTSNGTASSIPLKSAFSALPETAAALGDSCWYQAVVNPGESYLALGDEWVDWADLLWPDGSVYTYLHDYMKAMGAPAGMDMVVDNYPIKGYARVMAILSGLTLTAGGRELSLSPAFALTETDYSAAAGSGISSVTVSAEAFRGMTVTIKTPDGSVIGSGDGSATAAAMAAPRQRFPCVWAAIPSP